MNTMNMKAIQVPAQLRRNGQPSLGYGEARIHQIRAEKEGVNLGEHVRFGVPIPSTLPGMEKPLEPGYDAVVYVPAWQAIMDKTYDRGVFEGTLKELFSSLAGQIDPTQQKIVVTMSEPGTVEGPDEETQEQRRQRVQVIATEFPGVEVEFRTARADLPRERVDVSDVTDGVEFSEGDLFIAGSRRLESGSETRQRVGRAAARMILDRYQPSRVVTPLAVGISLWIAEEAVQRDIPVVMAHFTDHTVWADYNQQRVAALKANPLVCFVGENGWKERRITTVVRNLGEMARLEGAKIVTVDDPAGSEASQIRGATNLWEAMKSLLGANGESLSANERRSGPNRTQAQAWTPGSALAGATAGAMASSVPVTSGGDVDLGDLPF